MYQRVRGYAYRQPDRDESLSIASGPFRLVDGAIRISITEPMDEIAYVDHLKLKVVDRPPGVSATPDERFAPGGYTREVSPDGRQPLLHDYDYIDQAPLPWRGMPDFPFGREVKHLADPAYDMYLREYQTRPAGGR
jgi:hypothetical protein